MKKVRVIVLAPVYVPDYGRVDVGEHALPEEVARLLMEREFAVYPDEEEGGKKGKKEKGGK